MAHKFNLSKRIANDIIIIILKAWTFCKIILILKILPQKTELDHCSY